MPRGNIAVISDLHLSEGAANGRVSTLEDFFYDVEFERFCQMLAKRRSELGGAPFTLVCNGDSFDFLQVLAMPGDPEAKAAGFEVSFAERREKNGLLVTGPKSAWKMRRIARGHARFFAALGRFLAEGNFLVFVIGNHDIELHFPEVQLALRDIVLEHARKAAPSADDLDARFAIEPWFLWREGLCWIEHGQQYDEINSFRFVLNPALPAGRSGKMGEEIDLPIGSYFVRYFFNKIERRYPFCDNLKPMSAFLEWILRHHPFELGRLIRHYLPSMFAALRLHRMLSPLETARLRDEHARRVDARAESSPDPEAIRAIARMHELPVHRSLEGQMRFLLRQPNRALTLVALQILAMLAGVELFAGILSVVPGFAGRVAFRYLLAIAIVLALGVLGQGWLEWLRERSPDLHAALMPTPPPKETAQLRKKAHRIAELVQVPSIVMGHTHDCDRSPVAALRDGRTAYYLNCGTWTEVLTDGYDLLRDQRRFTYVEILEATGEARLMRFVDAAVEGREVLCFEEPAPGEEDWLA